IGFFSKVKGVWWKILLLGSLVLCEIALILAGARAGWVSYPLILFMCWLFFYFSKEGRLESFHFAWRDLVKVAVSVPITIAISFLLIFQVFMPLSDSLRNQGGSKAPIVSSESTSQYIKEQTARIIEPSQRFLVWTQGVDVGRESPLFGMGYESFCWHANILAGIAESYYTVNKANKFGLVLDDPHNIFLSLFVSGGFAGVGLWALIIGYGLMILVVDLVRNKRLLNVPVIISIISSHIYGVFQSTQYIPMIWFLVFLCLGYAMTLDEKVLPDRIRRIVGYVVKVMMFLVLVGGVVYFVDRGSQGLAEKYGLEVYAKDQDWHKYHGFYDREKWGETFYRWSGAKASVVISGQWSVVGGQMAGVGSRGSADERVAEFDLQCHTPGVVNEPVRVVISLNGERIDDLWFDKKGSLKRQYYVGKKENGGEHELLFEVSRTWNPKRLGVSEDWRDLGVAVSEVRFLDKMPKDGVGFYYWETWGGGKIPGWPKNTLGRFRWTGMRASMLSTDYPSTIVPSDNKTSRTKQPSMTLFLMCAHPDIDKNPVVLKILSDDKLLKQETFVDHQWRKVLIEPEVLNNLKILTFQVNRTWNPKAAGLSEDWRDLGVAIAAY
ncbi:MAG: O-antigen ligase family protein, partial [Deltaproteobacteria bacterium]|nr:O-antigen ligase family protein [Deltaproteobacteria bacterium]